jgi:hypothetical protein
MNFVRNKKTMEESKDKCIIFPHVPKCGGTSLLNQFKNADIKVFLDYDRQPQTTKYFQDECERRNWEFSFLDFSHFDLVFGHFPITRYDSDHYHYVTLLRHPLERAISHYFYWKNQLPETNLIAIAREPIILDIKKGKIDFLEFAKQQKLDMFYSSYLGDKKPADFLLVGFVDRYQEFTNQLSQYLKVTFRADVHLRKGSKDEINPRLIKKVEKLLSKEIEKYEIFQRYWIK